MGRGFFELFYFKIYVFLNKYAPSHLGIERAAANLFLSLLLYLKFLSLSVILISVTLGFVYVFIGSWLLLFSLLFFIWLTHAYLGKRHHEIFRKYRNQKKNNQTSNITYFSYTFAVFSIFIMSVYFCSKYY